MNRVIPYLKKVAAAGLLSLLLYIPVEKNFHTHAAEPSAETKGGAHVLHSVIACLICDYQVSAADELPDFYSAILHPESVNLLTESLPFLVGQTIPSFSSERGPPFIC